MQDPTLASLNARGIELCGQGRAREAIAVFAEGIARFPNASVLYHNLAIALDEIGAPKEALQAYESALMRAPHMTAALVGKANLLMRDGRLEEARGAFDAALAVDPDCLAAHLGLYELLQIQGDSSGALEHQRRALKRQRLFSQVASNEVRSVLVLCAPGDWQANVPVDFLFDRATTSLHKLYLLDDAHMRAEQLPRYDVAFNAIAESEPAAPYLKLAQAFFASQRKPSLNSPERVLAVGRLRLSQTLDRVDCTVAPIEERTRERLQQADLPFGFPAIVRPVGSQAGHGLARLTSPSELAEYLDRTDAPAYFVSPFIDYSNSDGFFRKYRIVFVDGEPYPVHLAISPDWMIHYYNAPMAQNAWMRDEEARFLADLTTVFAGPLAEALDGVARAVGLEYFGIDCSIGRDGSLLIFEADPAMLVHTSDPVDLYPYKREFIPRIYRAIERMLDRRKAADT